MMTMYVFFLEVESGKKSFLTMIMYNCFTYA